MVEPTGGCHEALAGTRTHLRSRSPFGLRLVFVVLSRERSFGGDGVPKEKSHDVTSFLNSFQQWLCGFGKYQ